MNKIKINKQVEEEIGVVSMLCLLKGRTAHEFLDNIMEEYKKTEGKKLFTADETDSIMQILESMPGYTPEKFFTACTVINDVDEDNKMKVFQDAGFKLKELIIKQQHNCRATGYWKTNSVKYNFLLIAHEYLFVFRK